MMSVILQFVSVTVIFSFVYLGLRMERWWGLSRLYISPPLAGGIIGAFLLSIGFFATGFFWTPSEQVTHWLVTSFLFFIGVKIGCIYTKRHILVMGIFLLITVVPMLLLEGLAWFFFRGYPLFREWIGTSTLAWNPEWIEHIQAILPVSGNVQVVSQTTLLIVFLISPFVIRLMQTFSPPDSGVQTRNAIKIWNLSAFVLHVTITGVALWLKHTWFSSFLFVFDYVISMLIGVMFGVWLRKTGWEKKHHFLQTVQQMGTLSLYGFIVAMMLGATAAILTHGTMAVTAILMIKIIVISILFIWLARKWAKNHRRLVLLSACWSFTLSAPVACMNAMRSVTDRHGEADNVLLIVPPVVLWLMNYPHYALFTWLYRF
ncbi:hypothetical protein O9H85_32290 [Paenibacillus filicis]|uniref:Uncharacterized protein n=1 Tax=Paenibacillus gyeongsangnamensis TaxID=3388067 RepID=A0ABT4QJA5_9BACL|nr:hypothetical protein [Paenibacillus filicis]MCZ8516956.1 hypothetical protein [Paenibacillus filicis]